MKLKDILHTPFPKGSEWRPLRQSMVDACLSDDSDFCREVVDKGILTTEQMAHAAERYRLGKSRSGKCIFWMIDETGRLCDGRVGASWVSQLLKARSPKLLRWYFPLHCLFGMHLISSSEGRESHEGHETVCVVPSERTAIILSELFPRHIWLAAMYPANLTEWHLQFLLGRKVVLYPPAGDTGDCWLAWEDIASRCRQRYGMDITVRDFLSRF